MCETILFSKDALEKLSPDQKQYEVADRRIHGLRIMVNPGGSKTFFLYRKINGRPYRIKIGRYPNVSIEVARKTATEMSAKIDKGENPHLDRKASRHEMTFRELYDRYYNEHALIHTRHSKENRRMMEVHIFPVFGNYQLRTITPDMIKRLHAKIGEKHKGGSNRVFAIVNAIFNFGIKQEYFKGSNPCFGLKKFKSVSRDRFLRPDELKKFMNALDSELELFQDFFKLALYTGARKSNLLAMCWSDIDLNLKRWRLSGEQTKNKDVNIILLSQPALEILERRKKENEARNSPSLYVFPGDGVDGHLKDPKKSFARIKGRMEVDDFRIHDLRRTLGSYMAISGASLPIIGKALNHKSIDSTAIYARLSHAPVINAIEAATTLMHTV